MRTGGGLAFFALALLFIVPGAHAQVLDLTVSVDGMACPFYAFGVEKKLRKNPCDLSLGSYIY
jgi:hypothetical protein